jgi:large subunit ribosomal protein L21
MYAIVATGGKQYKVAKGDIVSVEKLDAQPGDTVELDVLMLNDGKTTIVDPDALKTKKVAAEVLEQYKGEKVLVFKLKKRKRYHRTNGHRQNLTKLLINELPVSNDAAKSASTEADE